MTSLVRRFLKTGIAFLAIGLLIGLWMIVRRELLNEALSPWMVSAHTHALLVGFVMMMILGVALWMFPRPVRGDTRYRPAVAEAAYWMVTTGTGARVAGELMRTTMSGPWLRWAIVLASLLQGAGLVAFFLTMWPRIRAVGSQAREASGERF